MSECRCGKEDCSGPEACVCSESCDCASDVTTVALGTTDWVRSEFPHRLVTLDFDADDNLITVEVVGKRILQ